MIFCCLNSKFVSYFFTTDNLSGKSVNSQMAAALKASCTKLNEFNSLQLPSSQQSNRAARKAAIYRIFFGIFFVFWIQVIGFISESSNSTVF